MRQFRQRRRGLAIGLTFVALFATGVFAAASVAGVGPLGALTTSDTGSTDTTSTSTDPTTADTTSTETTTTTDTTSTDTMPTETPTDPAPTPNAPCAATGNETVSTNKADYAPEETAHITGHGYAPSCDVVVKITRPDGSIFTGAGTSQPGSDTPGRSARGG